MNDPLSSCQRGFAPFTGRFRLATNDFPNCRPLNARCIILLVLTCALQGGLGRLAAVEGATNLAEEGLLADDPVVAQAAFEAQSADPTRHAHLVLILNRLTDQLTVRSVREQKSISTALAAALDEKSLAELATAVQEHRAAARPAVKFLFDDKQYPVPAEAHTGWTPGVDVQPGQEEAEKRYLLAAAKYDALQRLYHARLLALIAALEPGAEKAFAENPQPPLPQYLQEVDQLRAVPLAARRDRLAESRPVPIGKLAAPDLTCETFLQRLATHSAQQQLLTRKVAQLTGWLDQLAPPAKSLLVTAPAPVPAAAPAVTAGHSQSSPALRALTALVQEDYAGAAKLAGGLPQTAGFAPFWRLTCDQAVLIHNARRQGQQPHEAWQLREVNLYRLSLDLRPMVLNDALQTAAKKHGAAMRDKMFFGHYDPDPARNTPQQRVALEGYRGGIGENIASGPDGTRSLWRWRSDAGHHRVLALPGFCEAGFAEVSGCDTLDVGLQPTAPIQKLFAAPQLEPRLPAQADPSRPRLVLLP